MRTIFNWHSKQNLFSFWVELLHMLSRAESCTFFIGYSHLGTLSSFMYLAQPFWFQYLLSSALAAVIWSSFLPSCIGQSHLAPTLPFSPLSPFIHWPQPFSPPLPPRIGHAPQWLRKSSSLPTALQLPPGPQTSGDPLLIPSRPRD